MLIINPELKELIPPLQLEEYQLLEKSITEEGCRDSLVIWGNTIIDGHNRYEICNRNNIEFSTKEMSFQSIGEVKVWMINNQFSRRNLPLYQRAVLALKLKPIYAERAKINIIEGAKNKGSKNSSKANIIPRDTRQELSKQSGVSEDTISRVEKIEEKATPEIKAKLASGNISINKAYNEVRKEERKKDLDKQIEDIETGKVEMPKGKFEVIVIDPPWNYGTQFDAGGRRVANPYPEMKQEELLELDIPSSDDSIIFLWTTHKFIWNAKELLEKWGYTYRSILVWNKKMIGMGDLFRMQCEFCLVGLKGKPILNNNHTFRDIFEESRRQHSRKPEVFYEMVNELCVGRKLDFFSRANREGWEVFGNDANKF